jgi:hypothetical protein
VDDLVVDSHLETIVVDDEDADTAPAVVERLGQAVEEGALVEDREALLDIAGLGHGNNAAILADVENAVLLEDRAEHVLDDDGRGRVGDEAGLLMKLLGEEVHTKVAVLASLGRRGDADDLARAALEDQEIANADVVARDGDGVGGRHLAGFGDLDVGHRGADGGFVDGSGGWSGRAGGGGGAVEGSSYGRGSRAGVLLLDNDLLAAVFVLGSGVGVRVGVVVAVTVDGVDDVVGDLVGGFGDVVAEAVVVAVVVVISHITLELLGFVYGGASRLYSNLFPGRVAAVDGVKLATGGVAVVLGVELLAVAGALLVAGVGAEASTGDDGTSALSELAFGDVDLGGTVVRSAADGVELTVVGLVLDLEVTFEVRAAGCLEAERKEKVSFGREGKRREKWVPRVALTTGQRIGWGPCIRGRGLGPAWLARASR